MKLLHLRTFITVADQSSITRAARKLSLAPSTVSAHIAALENEYGVQLFLRTHNGVRLTEAGHSLERQAREVLAAAAEFEIIARSCLAGVTGNLRLALSVSEPLFDLSAFSRRLSRQFPDVDLQLSRDESQRILESLKQEDLDMGIVYGKNFDAGIFSQHLGQAELVVALPKLWSGEAYSARKPLGELPWIKTGAACPYQQIIEEFFAKLDINPPQYLRADNNRTRRQLVAGGLGVSLLERHEAEHPHIVVGNFEPLFCDYSLVCLAHRQFDPVIRAARELILELIGAT